MALSKMLDSLLALFKKGQRQRREQQQLTKLSHNDAAALAQQQHPDSTRVLVVRDDSIGDYLLYRPWLRQLHAVLSCRGQKLTLVANKLWAPLAQAWDADLFETILAVDFKQFGSDRHYRNQMLQAIGEVGAGEVLYPLHVRQAFVENFIRFLHAPVRIASQGSHPTGLWFSVLDKSYTHLLPSTREVVFEYYRNREFFECWQQVTGTCLAQNPAILQLPATVHTAGALERLAVGLYIVLFPGASARQKRWPTAHFAQLARGLYQVYGSRYKLIIAGSPDDDELARSIIKTVGPSVPLLNRCGQTDLPRLAALLAGAQLLVSNDTVAAHLAVQAGTRTIVMLMGENYGKFFPYPPELLQAPCQCLFPPSQERRFAQGNFAPPARDPKIRHIDPARVLATATQLLAD